MLIGGRQGSGMRITFRLTALLFALFSSRLE